MISSTMQDLPKHRAQVLDACLRQSMFPLMMEHLPANDAEAISASLDLVNRGEIYLGIFAHRYGYKPVDDNPKLISITEMEYNRAVERGIPRLIFLIDKTHALTDFTIDDIDKGESAEKLVRFKARLEKENVVNYFKSPEDLRAHVINSLSQLHLAGHTAAPLFGDIPAAPDPYIAHIYTLLQTPSLVGRQKELSLLTDWVTDPQSARIINFVAIGGTGKSAVTWHWFKNIAPQEMKPLAGRMWWSFYEPDATFENFVTRALAYVTQMGLETVQAIPQSERETRLLAALDHAPFLLILDGFERLLNAYSRMDAARLDDSQVGDERNMRKTADPRVGRFLRKLAQSRSSRVLISTRLYPAELETDGGEPIPGTYRYQIGGLTDEDAVDLFRKLGVTGAKAELLPIFSSVKNHSLLIQTLAGTIKKYHRAPGDFDKWHAANLTFDPIKIREMSRRMEHVLEIALADLPDRPRQALHLLAAFRRPTGYDTLSALLVGEGKSCANENELDQLWTELEDRGLVGWDRRANRYDLHPIVRGVVWGGLGDEGRRGVFTSLHAHFEVAPKIDDYLEVNSLEDLTPTIELYHTLIGLGRYDDACDLFYERLSNATLYRLRASRQRVELLEQLFPDGLDQLPHLTVASDQGYTRSALAQGYQFSGQPGYAVPLFQQDIAIQPILNDMENLGIVLNNLSSALCVTGGLRKAEAAARRALVLTRERKDDFAEAVSLYSLGLALVARGEALESESALRRSLRMRMKQSIPQGEGVVNAFLAQQALGFGELAAARKFADCAWEQAHVERHEADFIRSARAQGEAALGLNDLGVADERLHYALARARAVNLVEEELPTLVALAELRRREGDANAARALLEDIWDYAERGPYPLFHADALNILAQIERDAGNRDAAIAAATRAYELAWCDGPPYAYHWGLIAAEKQLNELGAPLPEMPPFDESKFEPMPEVEIDPEPIDNGKLMVHSCLFVRPLFVYVRGSGRSANTNNTNVKTRTVTNHLSTNLHE